MTQAAAIRFFLVIVVAVVILAGVLFVVSFVTGGDDPETEALQPPWQAPEIPQVPQSPWSQEDPWGEWR